MQIYVEFKQRQTHTYVRAALPGAHIEPARGSAWQNYVYCTKEDSKTGRFEFSIGTFTAPRNRESKNELGPVTAAIREGKSEAEIANLFPEIFVRHCNGIPKLIGHLQTTPEVRSVCVVLLTGPSGTGKSYWARQYAHFHGQSLFSKMIQRSDETQWFDGYQGQDVLLLDDFDKGQVPFRTLLTWLDVYKLTVQRKGSTAFAKWGLVVITSNTTPQEWYPNEDLGPLWRRITHQYECEQKYAVNYVDYKTRLVGAPVQQFVEPEPDIIEMIGDNQLEYEHDYLDLSLLSQD